MPACVNLLFFTSVTILWGGTVVGQNACCSQCRDQYVTSYGNEFGWMYDSPEVIGAIGLGMCQDNGCDKNCQPGFYQTSTPCVSMSTSPKCAACPSGKFSTSVSVTACSSCTICLASQVQDRACTSTQDASCRDCAAGKYRGSPGTFSDCQTCTVCANYQVETSPCGPINNRVCQSCGSGQTVVNNACRTCDAGKYTLDSVTCQDCVTCAIGKYADPVCTSSQARVCKTCATGYTNTATNLNVCDRCADGYFQAAGYSFTCSLCSTSTQCSFGNWIKCVGGTRECVVCDGHDLGGSTQCVAGMGISQVCSGQTTQNTPCTDCAAGFERPAGTAFIDRIQLCVKCGLGKYKANAGKADCAACTNKPANSEYRAWGLSETATTASCPW